MLFIFIKSVFIKPAERALMITASVAFAFMAWITLGIILGGIVFVICMCCEYTYEVSDAFARVSAVFGGAGWLKLIAEYPRYDKLRGRPLSSRKK